MSALNEDFAVVAVFSLLLHNYFDGLIQNSTVGLCANDETNWKYFHLNSPTDTAARVKRRATVKLNENQQRVGV